MKKLLLILSICFSLSTSAQEMNIVAKEDYNEKLESKMGFQHIVLGTSIDSLLMKSKSKPVIVDKERQREKIYGFAKPEEFSLGDLKLNMLTLETFDGKIYSISLMFSQSRFDDMLKTLQIGFGAPGYVSGTSANIFYWESESVILKLYRSVGGTATVNYILKPLQREVNASGNKSNIERANRL